MYPCVRRAIRVMFVELSMLTIAAGGSLAAPSDADLAKKMAAVRARAEQGYVQEQIELAAAYLAGRGVPHDAVQAAHWYLKAAESGSPEAENEIGYFYQTGIGVPADLERAVHWFQLASASGMAWAKVNLGVSYLRGNGVRADPSTARRLFLEAVDKGAGPAATYLGVMAYFGFGTPVDKAAAEHWFQTGAKLHDPESSYDLAILICQNEGPRHNLRRASELLRTASAKGLVAAKHALGLLLVNHPELAQSPLEARLALETASDAGNWRSSTLVAILERDGRSGSAADPSRAYYHFRLAALQGGEEGERAVGPDVAALKLKLSSEQQAALGAQAEASFQMHKTPMAFVLKRGDKDGAFPAFTLADSAPRP
jgi:hypothetical protein